MMPWDGSNGIDFLIGFQALWDKIEIRILCPIWDKIKLRGKCNTSKSRSTDKVKVKVSPRLKC